MYDACNVFFVEDVEDKLIYEMIRKNVDILHGYRIVNNVEEKGKVVVCIDDDDIKKVEQAVQQSKEYCCVGDGEVNLTGTTISVEALIVEKV